MDVSVKRSAKRRKTVSARLVGGTLEVSIPARMTKAEERHWVEEMRRRVERRHHAGEVDLAERAHGLAQRYGLPRPRSIRWADNQRSRWGSCTPAEGSVRISTRLAGYPDWVLDYVVVHELAHLEVGDHSPAFWAIVARYPKAERAQGFLMAKSGDDTVPNPPDC